MTYSLLQVFIQNPLLLVKGFLGFQDRSSGVKQWIYYMSDFIDI